MQFDLPPLSAHRFNEEASWITEGIADVKEGTELLDKYQMGRVLGTGTFSTVRLARRKNDGALFAIKVLEKFGISTGEQLRREILVLTEYRHPNVICLEEIYETETELYLVMEFAAGGELFDRIVERGVYSERQAAEVVTRVLEALVYLHSHNIIHRDIKPENLLLAGKDSDVEVKLSDFGVVAILEAVEVERANSVASESVGGGGLADDSLAGGGGGGGGGLSGRSRIPSGSVAPGGRGRAFTAVGSDTYTAPEMLRGDGYDERVDLWSTGVVLYILLCGFPPFQDNQFEWCEGQSRRRLVFPEEHWSGISEAAKDLLMSLLTDDPEERFSAQMALTHPFIRERQMSASVDPLCPMSYTDNMRNFNTKRKFSDALGSGSATPGSVRALSSLGRDPGHRPKRWERSSADGQPSQRRTYSEDHGGMRAGDEPPSPLSPMYQFGQPSGLVAGEAGFAGLGVGVEEGAIGGDGGGGGGGEDGPEMGESPEELMFEMSNDNTGYTPPSPAHAPGVSHGASSEHASVGYGGRPRLLGRSVPSLEQSMIPEVRESEAERSSGGSMSSMHADSRPASRTVSPRGSIVGSGLTSPRGSMTMAEAQPLAPPNGMPTGMPNGMPSGVPSGPLEAQDSRAAAAGANGGRLQPTPMATVASAGNPLPPPPPQLADARSTSTAL